MKLIILLTLLINTSQAYKQRRPIATIESMTNSGKQCMTNCVPFEDYHFCYLGSGSDNWEKCKVGKNDRHVQYYTSLDKDNKPFCTSKCDYYGETYQWCFTGEDGLWDKCSTNREKCYDCSKYSNGYQCKTPDGDLHFCAPDPIYFDEFDKLKHLLNNYGGKYTTEGYIKNICKTSRPLNDEVKNNGIYNAVSAFEALYNTTYLRKGPISSIVSLTVPSTNTEMINTRLPLVIRAKLRSKYVSNVRQYISPYIEHQMDLMDRNPSDKTLHLLADSLGSPTKFYNFAPQTPIVNRKFGGESYWSHIEGNLHENLRDSNVDYIDWTLVIIYDLHLSKRPIGFGLRYIIYYNQIHGMIQYKDTGDMFFSNDPEGGCPI